MSKHQLACRVIERARRFVTQEHFGTFRDRARNSHALLFATGKLCRKVIETFSQTDHAQRFLGIHRVFGNLGHQRHVLKGRKAWDQVIELEHKTNVLAAESRESRIACRRQVVITVQDLARLSEYPALPGYSVAWTFRSPTVQGPR